MMGRPAIEITPELCERARQLAGKGLSRAQIALKLGMGESTLYEKQAKFPEFLESIEQGALDANEKVMNALFETAITGNVSACQTWLYNKDRPNWQKEPREELSREIPPINIHLYSDEANKTTD